MPIEAIAALALGTLAFRLAGPLLQSRVTLTPAIQALFSEAAVVLLFALVATATFLQGDGFSGYARVAGVTVGGVLAVVRIPFPAVVLAAAAATAALRYFGVN